MEGIMAKFGEKLDRIITYTNAIVTTFDQLGKVTPQAVKDKLPMFLGLSLEDERIWAGLTTQLTMKERGVLTAWLNDHLKDYERNHFRYVVVGIPKSEVKTETGSGKNKKTSTVQKSRAVNFLKNIVRLINDEGMEAAYDQCLAGGTIISDPFSVKIMAGWKEGVTWFKKNVLHPFGAKSLSDLQKLAEDASKKALASIKNIDASLATKIVPRKDRGFLEEAFGFLWGK
jgi:hypothetical protein